MLRIFIATVFILTVLSISSAPTDNLYNANKPKGKKVTLLVGKSFSKHSVEIVKEYLESIGCPVKISDLPIPEIVAVQIEGRKGKPRPLTNMSHAARFAEKNCLPKR